MQTSRGLNQMLKLVKKVDDALVKQVASLELQCWRNAQYSRRECVKIIGIPNSIVNSDLEKTVCKVFIEADICEEKIKSCHCLNIKSDRAIVKFSWRKDCEQVMRVKNDLKVLNPTDLDFPGGARLFINDSFCPYYRGLWNECKKLWINKKIFSFFAVDGTCRLKLEQDGPYNSLTYVDDLKSLFREENFTMSSL